MLVTCKGCKSKIDRDNAFKVVINNKNNYYCNAEEYNNLILEKESRSKVIDLSFQIIGETTNTYLMKELKTISEVHSYHKMSLFLEQNVYELIKTMNKITGNEFGKIRYFAAIMKNELGEFEPKIEEDESLHNFEYVYYKYNQTKKKSFNQFIEEY
jgi:hypothetical protein